MNLCVGSIHAQKDGTAVVVVLQCLGVVSAWVGGRCTEAIGLHMWWSHEDLLHVFIEGFLKLLHDALVALEQGTGGTSWRNKGS